MMAVINQNNDAFTIRHSLTFTGLEQENLEQVFLALHDMPGMISAKRESDQLRLEYDASKCQLNQCLELLQKWRITPKQSWWNRLKLNWAKQTDQNIWNNARHVPHCCSKPPSQGRIKR